ncbi:MAG: hypothetical protein ACPGXL_01200 [Chitinophagales bacterium]
MEQQKTSNKPQFTKWLEILQQESWQLELLISGFAIFLLLGAYDPIVALEYKIKLLAVSDQFYAILQIPYGIFLGAWYVLVINLILHVLLRGLWISTIGLRYVSGDIDFDSLQFNSKFDRFLRKRMGSFDAYIERLEGLCSIIFAFTFLVIFVLLSGGLFLGYTLALGLSIDWFNDRFGDTGVLIFLPIVVLVIIGWFFYAIDFLTLGMIKRRKRLARFYYPIYRFFSFLTLSFVYRPLYYNLIDHKFGRRVVFIIVPYLILVGLISSITVRTHAFLPFQRSKQSLNPSHYEDSNNKQIDPIFYKASIPSKFVSNGFIPLYIPYRPIFDDKAIQRLCPDLKPAKTGTGFSGFFVDNGDLERFTMNADSALLCNAKHYEISVNDSLFSNLKFRFYDHPIRKKSGLMSILDIAYLPRGEHLITIKSAIVKRRRGKSDTLLFAPNASIPFWKE